MQTGFLTKRVDNAPLIFFRIAFGLLLTWHCAKHIYAKELVSIYLKAKYLFPFIGFEWLKPLPGNGMYWYFGIMGVAAFFVAIGLFYRYSLFVTALLFTGTYLMQKTIYNNHHYLVILLCLLLLIMPANRYASVDVALKPSLKRYSMPQWCRYIIVFQVAIVYTFAAIAKMYPTWVDGTYTSILMSKHRNPAYALVTQNHYFHLFLAWGGMLFDLLIAPLLLIKRTRLLATLAMVFFHLFNAYTLHIGIFPYLALSLLVFFYPPDIIRKRLFWFKGAIPENELNDNMQPNIKMVKWVLIPYAVIQVALPLRHWFIPGDVLYTEEGHRLSWRMKLHSKNNDVVIMAKEQGSNHLDTVPLKKYFTKKQILRFGGRPDMVWQAVQYIKSDYESKGKKVVLYASSKVSINREPKRETIDTTVNLAEAKWDHWRHNEWILKNDD